MLADSSASRHAEFLLGAAILALATPLPLTLFTQMSAHRIYVAQLVVGLAALIGSIPEVRRALVPAALAQFVRRGLDRTETGVLVYVSLAEHCIRIVPAEAAAAAVPREAWQTAVDRATPQLAAGAMEAALKELADDCAALLAAPFPPEVTPDALRSGIGFTWCRAGKTQRFARLTSLSSRRASG